MKLVRDLHDKSTVSRSPDEQLQASGGRRVRSPWRMLVVDDDPDVRAVTRLNLKDFGFAGRGLEIIDAESGYQARKILQEHDDIAVALIDVVMETDDAGLRLVELIREQLGNSLIRLIIRTGQPGSAPERFVIDHFDIDDYKDKTELTATRLYTTVRSAIKAYRDLRTIDLNRIGLSRVLDAVPDIYRLSDSPESLNQFFEGVLTQIIGMCNLSERSLLSTIDGVVATIDGKGLTIQAATHEMIDSRRLGEVRSRCVQAIHEHGRPYMLDDEALVIPLAIAGQAAGFIYVEPTGELTESDLHLLGIFAHQCAAAMENLRLHIDLSKSYDNAIDTLAEVAEFKDKTTGDHINRIDHYTRLVAIELGVSPDEARIWGKASRLHDVGKVGIPDAVLRKPGRLTAEEYEVIRNHTSIGASILAHDKLMSLARDIALNHHEWWNGRGYPAGCRARELSLATRIVSVVDVFDALTSVRPYKQAWGIDASVAELKKGAGTQFDPTVVDAFVAVLERGDLDYLIESVGGSAAGRDQSTRLGVE